MVIYLSVSNRPFDGTHSMCFALHLQRLRYAPSLTLSINASGPKTCFQCMWLWTRVLFILREKFLDFSSTSCNDVLISLENQTGQFSISDGVCLL